MSFEVLPMSIARAGGGGKMAVASAVVCSGEGIEADVSEIAVTGVDILAAHIMLNVGANGQTVVETMRSQANKSKYIYRSSRESLINDRPVRRTLQESAFHLY